jgi:hypothetical protein
MGNELLYKNILPLTVFQTWVVVPTHWTAIRKHIDRRLDFLCDYRLVDKTNQLD